MQGTHMQGQNRARRCSAPSPVADEAVEKIHQHDCQDKRHGKAGQVVQATVHTLQDALDAAPHARDAALDGLDIAIERLDELRLRKQPRQ